MFTGLIQAIGTISTIGERAGGIEVRVRVPEYAGRLAGGESIAIDGCCLTVEQFADDWFSVFATPETIKKTALGDRAAGDRVNLERALALGDRMGGHMVSGHVDTTGRFRSATPVGDSWEVWIEAPLDVLRQSIPKGSIAVDGISLTLVELTADAFSLWIIPETWQRTTLSLRKPGDRVNLEVDPIGKYVYKYLELMVGGAEGARSLEEAWKRFRS